MENTTYMRIIYEFDEKDKDMLDFVAASLLVCKDVRSGWPSERVGVRLGGRKDI